MIAVPERLLTLGEWDALPKGGSHRCELVGGVPLVVPRPAPIHQRVAYRLTGLLEAHLPEEFAAFGDVEVVVNPVHPATLRAPDVVVVPSRPTDEYPARFSADEVLLAVEIVSPGTGRTDRVTKPAEYADAGIPHYWLVDLDAPASLDAFTLVDGDYEHVAGGSGKVRVLSPFTITVDLAELIRN
ncbi:Uma2 family endonuclease [Saccharothrix coeruleofusca]|uniref:Putative restriction endonuclease domain-containing protein n=1 Tax=Saccharothrix coeruleofusca TaxID=33919 RepID=A0A918AKQ4_9PSEU|nr:Uma2 family endonuclease [Saccharothrix coeruleofusca]MBP2338275.1 Uma2 family endonuclease [Saccharothrix coeruleofusca]GGP49504.1 hypothetical protein GCM10010185_22100 [Saccharothrix coeruleofusca]